MHDVTEGGVLGACWEMAQLAGCGLVVDTARIRVLPETRALCAAAGLDPLRLIGSGSLLIACPDGEAMAAGLCAQGVEAAVIGHADAGAVRTAEGGAHRAAGRGRAVPPVLKTISAMACVDGGSMV